MEKGNLYPDMPENQGMPDAPPNYAQSQLPSAPSSGCMTGMMVSPGPVPMGISQQPIMVQNMTQIPPLGPKPCMVTCPSCHQQKMSSIRFESATKTHLFAALMCVLGLCCCACFPYFMDSCKNANHYCSNCDAYLGMYNK